MNAAWSRTVLLGAREPGAISPLGALLSVAVVAAALLVLVPLVLVGGVLAAAVLGAFSIKRWLTAQRAPNGMLDGRKNVRVRLPDGNVGEHGE